MDMNAPNEKFNGVAINKGLLQEYFDWMRAAPRGETACDKFGEIWSRICGIAAPILVGWLIIGIIKYHGEQPGLRELLEVFTTAFGAGILVTSIFWLCGHRYRAERPAEVPHQNEQAIGVTPEVYLAAVKSCPRVAWVSANLLSLLYRGYATRIDGDKVEVVPDFVLSSKSSVRSYAKSSTSNNLWAWGSNGVSPIFADNVFFGEIPSEDKLHDYFVTKHGKPHGLNWLFPRRIQNHAAIEWVNEQLEKQRIQRKEQRARNLWHRYYSMFDELHVSAMSGSEFERFVGNLYTRLGYSVSFTQGGADLILYKDDHKVAVQAKRWSGPVGNAAVQEVIAGKLYYGCLRGMIVTNSSFSNSAVALAAKDPSISLVDGQALSKLCEEFRTGGIPNFSWDEWENIKHVAERFA
jgi:hypothetical protein